MHRVGQVAPPLALQQPLFCQLRVILGQGFPPNGEIPESLAGLIALKSDHSMQSSTCILRAEETTRNPKNSNNIQHPNEM